MSLWSIRWDAATSMDPPSGCRFITLSQTDVGFNSGLIECDEQGAARLRSHPGVTAFEPPTDGDVYVDTQTGEAVVVEDDGTRWREL